MIEILLLLAAIVVLSLGGFLIGRQITKETPFEDALAEQKDKGFARSLFKGDKSHKKTSVKLVKKTKSKKEEAAQKIKKQQGSKQKQDQAKRNADSEVSPLLSENKMNSSQRHHARVLLEEDERGLVQKEACQNDSHQHELHYHTRVLLEEDERGLVQEEAWHELLKQPKKQLSMEKLKVIPSEDLLSEEPLELPKQNQRTQKKEKGASHKQQQSKDTFNNPDAQEKPKSPAQKKIKVTSQKQHQIEANAQHQDATKSSPKQQQPQENHAESQPKPPSPVKKQQLQDAQRTNDPSKLQKSNPDKPPTPIKQNVEQPQKKTQGQKKASSKASQQQEVPEDKGNQTILAMQNSGMQDKAEQHKKLIESAKKKLQHSEEDAKKVVSIPGQQQSKEAQKSTQPGQQKKPTSKQKDVDQIDPTGKLSSSKISSATSKQDSKSSIDGSPSTPGKKSTPNQSPVVVKPKKMEINEMSSNVEEQMKLVSHQMQTESLEKRKREKKEDRRENKDKTKAPPLSDDELSRLMPLIRKAKLSSAEVQEVINTLLNKQQQQQQQANTSSEWVEKGRIDPVMSLKKQLDEAEVRLKEQKETHSGLSAKIANLRADLNSERAKSMALKKQLDIASTHFDQKIFAANASHNEQLKVKLNELHLSLDQSFQEKLVQHQQAAKRDREKHQQQFASAQTDVENQLQQYRQAQANTDKELQGSRSSASELEQQKQQLQAALADSQGQLQNAAQNREELVQTYQQHLASLKDKMTQQENTFNSQLGELKSKLSIAESSRTQSLTQYSQIVVEREQLKQKVNKLEDVTDLFSQSQSKLQTTIREKGDFEGRLHIAENDLSSVREVVQNQVEQIERLKEEKESLASQSVRPAAEGQENGDIHAEPQQPLFNEHLNMYEEKLSSLTKEITKLKEELSHQRRKNDELRTKNQGVLEALYTTEDRLKERLVQQAEEREKWEEENNRVKTAAKKNFPEFAIGETLDQAAFLSQVKTALDKKPQVVEKITEKIVEDPKLKQMVSDLKTENATMLQKIESLEKENAALELSKEKPHPSPAQPTASEISNNEDTERRLTHLEDENKGLNEKVAHYQEVLGNTESLLKDLQISVENEEAVWQGKLTHSDSCVRELKKENSRLSLELGMLQSSLEKVKQAEEMEHQLVTLREKLGKEEEEKKTLEMKLQKEEQSKVVLQEQLNNAQEQNKLAPAPQIVSNANGPSNGLEEQEIGSIQSQ